MHIMQHWHVIWKPLPRTGSRQRRTRRRPRIGSAMSPRIAVPPGRIAMLRRMISNALKRKGVLSNRSESATRVRACRVENHGDLDGLTGQIRAAIVVRPPRSSVARPTDKIRCGAADYDSGGGVVFSTSATL